MILSDGIIGQMMEKVELLAIDEVLQKYIKNFDKKTKTHVFDTSSWALTGCKDREPRLIRSLFMNDGELTQHNNKLAEKYKSMEAEVDWEEIDIDDAKVVLVGYGISSRIIKDACILSRKEGLKVGSFRLKTAYPFPSKRLSELARDKKFLVVEMSMGQMVEDVRLAVNGKNIVDFYGIAGGDLPEIEVIIQKIKNLLTR
jgi:pyruvate/2-oxoacid:ferredoxin oxidoreductase alpha subunit